MLSLKKCSNCQKIKSISEFSKKKCNKDGLNGSCKLCRIDSRRKIDWYRLYKISPRQYEKFFEKQKGCCAICGRHQSEFKRILAVDHCHKTGKIRGLLCLKCNLNLGVWAWSIVNKNKIQQYLKRER